MLNRNGVNKKKEPRLKRSRYNKNLLMQQCEICGYSPDINNSMSLPLDTHHINMQCMANGDGFINNFHKDVVSNLVPLCKKCHIDVHHNKIKINGWIQKDTGSCLSYNAV